MAELSRTALNDRCELGSGIVTVVGLSLYSHNPIPRINLYRPSGDALNTNSIAITEATETKMR